MGAIVRSAIDLGNERCSWLKRWALGDSNRHLL